MSIDDIKVGDYVRNKYGIAKVVEIEDKNDINILKFDRDICFMVDRKENKELYRSNYLPLTEYIDIDKINFSSNIIDLIEVGDYVNGIQINERIGDSVWHFSAYGDEDECLKSKDIKTILTHEQMEAMEYKIEK